MQVRQVADGMLAKVKPKPSISSLTANVGRAKAMVTSRAGPLTLSVLDTPRVGATYKMRMNRFVAADVGLGLDGQTKASIKVGPKEAKKIFKSKIVPFTDGTELLTGSSKKTMSQIGYGNVVRSSLPTAPKVQRIGFNNTLTSTAGGKLTVSTPGVRDRSNQAVRADFYRGPGGSAANQLFVDGTYEMTIDAIHKTQDARAQGVDFKGPVDIRRQVFEQQALVGNQVYGNALMQQILEEQFAEERTAQIQQAVRASRPLGSEEEIERLGTNVAVARRAAVIERQLRLPAGSVVAMEAARAEIEAEQGRRPEAEDRGQIDDMVQRAREAGRSKDDVARQARIAAAVVAFPTIAAERGAAGGAAPTTRESRAAEAMGARPAATARFGPRGASQTLLENAFNAATKGKASAAQFATIASAIKSAVTAEPLEVGGVPESGAARGGAGGGGARGGAGTRADELFARSYAKKM